MNEGILWVSHRTVAEYTPKLGALVPCPATLPRDTSGSCRPPADAAQPQLSCSSFPGRASGSRVSPYTLLTSFRGVQA